MTVTFIDRGVRIEVSVTHDLIKDRVTMQSHENGWGGCLIGLAEYLE
jgi:hypothetical protein